MGIDPMAAHMFILYYGCLSAISPPVAIAAFIAANLAEADHNKTGWTAMAFGWPIFVIPFLFVFSTTLLMKGPWLLIAGNFKRMGGREEEGLADIEEGNARLMEVGRNVDAHAYGMATACVSLLAGRYEEAEQVVLPAFEGLKAYGEAGYLSTMSAVAALALAGQGRYDEAEPFVDEAEAIGAKDDVSTQAFWRAARAIWMQPRPTARSKRS
jgi:TRAP-type uncharacterized transport system fused permease subunit